MAGLTLIWWIWLVIDCTFDLTDLISSSMVWFLSNSDWTFSASKLIFVFKSFVPTEACDLVAGFSALNISARPTKFNSSWKLQLFYFISYKLSNNIFENYLKAHQKNEAKIPSEFQLGFDFWELQYLKPQQRFHFSGLPIPPIFSELNGHHYCSNS